MGIYFDRCRYIGSLFWGCIGLFHYFFARNILGLFKVKENVIELTLEYLSISVFSVLINLNFLINQK
jgi:Na+-driven multidrug efflux pump